MTNYKKWLDMLGLNKEEDDDFREIAEIYVALKGRTSSPNYEIKFIEEICDWITIRTIYNSAIPELRLSPKSLNALLCEMRMRYNNGQDLEDEINFRDALDRN